MREWPANSSPYRINLSLFQEQGRARSCDNIENLAMKKPICIDLKPFYSCSATSDN